MRTLLTRYLLIGLAIVVGVVPVSFCQASQALDHDKPAETEDDAENGQTRDKPSDKATSRAWEHMGAFVAEPIGRFWVGPEFVDGEPVYILRTQDRQGITTVEASITPFEPTGLDELIGNPEEHPAGW